MFAYVPQFTKERSLVRVVLRLCFGDSFEDKLLRERKRNRFFFIRGDRPRVRGFAIGGCRLRRKARIAIDFYWPNGFFIKGLKKWNGERVLLLQAKLLAHRVFRVALSGGGFAALRRRWTDAARVVNFPFADPGRQLASDASYRKTTRCNAA